MNRQPEYICDACGWEEDLPFDVGDECVCGGRFNTRYQEGKGANDGQAIPANQAGNEGSNSPKGCPES